MYVPNKKEYDKQEFKIIEQCDLNRLSFDKIQFTKKISQIQDNLEGVICVENLNPRPETLLNDLEILIDIFPSSFQLKNKILFLFTSSNSTKSLEEIRNEILSFEYLFDCLTIPQVERMDFVIQNVWVRDKKKDQLNEMKDLIYQMIIGTGKYFSLFEFISIYRLFCMLI